MRPLSVVLVVGSLALAGCGSSSSGSSSAKAPATTATTAAASPSTLAAASFALHAGLAFGAFHHFIYEPLRAGDFRNLDRHKPAVVAAATAAVYVAHELKLAAGAAAASPSLAKLTPQLAILAGGFKAALAKLKAGRFKASEIEPATTAIESIKSGASAAGARIAERTPAVL